MNTKHRLDLIARLLDYLEEIRNIVLTDTYCFYSPIRYTKLDEEYASRSFGKEHKDSKLYGKGE